MVHVGSREAAGGDFNENGCIHDSCGYKPPDDSCSHGVEVIRGDKRLYEKRRCYTRREEVI